MQSPPTSDYSLARLSVIAATLPYGFTFHARHHLRRRPKFSEKYVKPTGSGAGKGGFNGAGPCYNT
jgi:hypothetical protein